MAIDTVRPLQLLDNVPVTLVIEGDSPDGCPARVEKVEMSGYSPRYVIKLYENTAAVMYKNSWLAGRVSLSDFHNGLLLHEVAHIKYDSFTSDSTWLTGDAVYQFIQNILEDSRIEYNLSREHPGYAQYLRYLLIALRDDTDLTASGRDPEVAAILDRKLETLYNLVRFGRVAADEQDEEFVNFLLPLVLSSTRGNRRNTLVASNAIYLYLIRTAAEEAATSKAAQQQREVDHEVQSEKLPGGGSGGDGAEDDEKGTESGADGADESDDDEAADGAQTDADGSDDGDGKANQPTPRPAPQPDPQDVKDAEAAANAIARNARKQSKATGDKEMAEVFEDLKGGSALIASNQFGMVNEMLTNDASLIQGTGTGGGTDELVDAQEIESEFYTKLRENNPETIDDLSKVFKRFFRGINIERHFDGDIAISRQQHAYVHSITGDQALDFQRRLPKDAGVDVLLFRDISGSTHGFRDQYATAAGVFLASLEGFKQVRTAMLDFESNYSVVKRFEEPLREARLFPISAGGTVLEGALREAQGFSYERKNRIAFVITDGGISHGYEPVQAEMEDALNMRFIFLNVTGAGYDKDTTDVDLTASPINLTVAQLPGVLTDLMMDTIVT